MKSNQTMEEFIQEELAKGKSREEIREEFINSFDWQYRKRKPKKSQ